MDWPGTPVARPIYRLNLIVESFNDCFEASSNWLYFGFGSFKCRTRSCSLVTSMATAASASGRGSVVNLFRIGDYNPFASAKHNMARNTHDCRVLRYVPKYD